MLGTVKGGRRQGRERKTWEDIRERTGLEFGKSQRAVENREIWRKLVAKSSVVQTHTTINTQTHTYTHTYTHTHTHTDAA